MYTTTQFISSSTYLQDGISVITNQQTSLLNFVGNDIVDGSKKNMNYQQMQPASNDGSMPLASNKWYMMQYEMAYDPNISQIPYNQIQLNWNLNYYNVETIDLGGTLQGTIKGTIGESTSNNLFAPLKNLGETIGKGVIAGVGQKILSDHEINSETGENNLGLNNKVFKAASTGMKNAVSAAAGNIPGAIIGLLSAIIGGAKTTPIPVSLNVATEIKLKGNGTNSGSFPSMPVSFWVPGTNIPSSTVGYIPLYNKKLGVVNFIGKPDVFIPVESRGSMVPDEPFDPDRMVQEVDYTAYPPSKVDYSNCLIINP